jgi:hypothetical protein
VKKSEKYLSEMEKLRIFYKKSVDFDEILLFRENQTEKKICSNQENTISISSNRDYE